MLIKVYHCGLTEIKSFNFSCGVHFGGIYSAMEAALRKVKNPRIETIYVHECLLELPDYIPEEDDLGSNEAWQELAATWMDRNEYGLLQYCNRYEPDIDPSYYVLDSSLIQLKKVRTLRPYQAEAELDVFLNYDY